jgi:hypothetical protein
VASAKTVRKIEESFIVRQMKYPRYNERMKIKGEVEMNQLL